MDEGELVMIRVIFLLIALAACGFDYDLIDEKAKIFDRGLYCKDLPAHTQEYALNIMKDLIAIYPQNSICDRQGFILRMGGGNE